MTAPVPTANWVHPATVLRVVDGDTVLVSLDLGRYPHRLRAEVPVRIAGLYAPELRAPGGPEARAALTALLDGPEPLVAQTRKPDPRDPYGRVVADLWTSAGVNVAEWMIEAGHGRGTPT